METCVERLIDYMRKITGTEPESREAASFFSPVTYNIRVRGSQANRLRAYNYATDIPIFGGREFKIVEMRGPPAESFEVLMQPKNSFVKVRLIFEGMPN
ncbi:MAG: hypothetical protein HY366_00985 [Candidatus Aenigmarchaeota archaeon]|nr:hypothetical protein [Candidatus Aenigmarchaeota archaeon]